MESATSSESSSLDTPTPVFRFFGVFGKLSPSAFSLNRKRSKDSEMGARSRSKSGSRVDVISSSAGRTSSHSSVTTTHSTNDDLFSAGGVGSSSASVSVISVVDSVVQENASKFYISDEDNSAESLSHSQKEGELMFSIQDTKPTFPEENDDASNSVSLNHRNSSLEHVTSHKTTPPLTPIVRCKNASDGSIQTLQSASSRKILRSDSMRELETAMLKVLQVDLELNAIAAAAEGEDEEGVDFFKDFDRDDRRSVTSSSRKRLSVGAPGLPLPVIVEMLAAQAEEGADALKERDADDEVRDNVGDLDDVVSIVDSELLRVTLQRFVEVDIVSRDNLKIGERILSLITTKERLSSLQASTLPVFPTESSYGGDDTSVIQKFIVADKEAIALQLTLMDGEYFSKITKDELLNMGWSGPQKMSLAPNITKKIDAFNALSKFVIVSILSTKSTRDRIKLLKGHIKVAQHALETFKNYDAVVSIVSALQCAGISRLKSMWKDLPQKHKTMYDDLCLYVDPRGNYKHLRLVTRASTSESFCVPYLGIYLQDLTFIHDGNPATLRSSSSTASLASLMTNQSLASHISTIGSTQQIGRQTTSPTTPNPEYAGSQRLSLRGSISSLTSIASTTSRQRISLTNLIGPNLPSVHSTLINFERCRLFARVIRDIRTHQSRFADFAAAQRRRTSASIEALFVSGGNGFVSPVQAHAVLRDSLDMADLAKEIYAMGAAAASKYNDTMLYQMSLELEPRRNQHGSAPSSPKGVNSGLSPGRGPFQTSGTPNSRGTSPMAIQIGRRGRADPSSSSSGEASSLAKDASPLLQANFGAGMRSSSPWGGHLRIRSSSPPAVSGERETRERGRRISFFGSLAGGNGSANGGGLSG
ncbi:hypothetical protein HDU76_007203 [Blyttiomyces sp. JEL0837]|nr:hypothetical protein HDU76_007203 [Blyttiomyces sp. JEL0837]